MTFALALRRVVRFAKKAIANNWVVLLLYLGLSVIYFSGSLARGRLPGPYEFLQIFPPFQVEGAATMGNSIQSDMGDLMAFLGHMQRALLQGELPLWNSLLGLGYPMFLNGTIGHFTPINFIALLTLPLPYYFLVTSCAKMVLFAFFLYKLMQQYDVDDGIAFIVGALLMTSPYFIGWVGTVIGDTYSCLPWVFFALTRAIRAPSRRTRLWLLLSLVYLLLTGFVPLTFYTALIGVGYVLTLLGRRVFSWRTIRLALMGVAALAITCIPIYYGLEYLFTVAAAGRTGYGNRVVPLGMASFPFFPELFGPWESGKALARIYYPEPIPVPAYTEIANYFSLFFALLVILNLVYLVAVPAHRRNRLVIFWTVVQVWSYSMVYNIFGVLTLFSQIHLFDINNNMRLLTYFILSSGILAGLTLHTALRRPRQHIRLEQVALGVVLGLVALVVVSFREIVLTDVDVRRHVLTQITLLLLIGLTLLLIVRSRGKFIRLGGLTLITLASLANTINFGSDYNSSFVPATFYPTTPVMAYLQENMQTEPGTRLYGMDWYISNYNMFYGVGTFQMYWYKSDEYVTLFRQLNPDYEPSQPGRWDWAAFRVLEHDDLMDFLNVKYIMVSEARLPTVLTTTTDEYGVIPFQNGVMLLENRDRPYSTEPPPQECDTNTLYSYIYENDQIAFETNFCEARTFDLPVQDYPGWSLAEASDPAISFAERDGLMTLTVPPGQQAVEMRFFPDRFYTLLAITLTGIVVGVAVVVIDRREQTPAATPTA